MTLLKIENPCTEDVHRMPKCGEYFYCNVCKKNVADLRQKSSVEIEEFARENKNACVIVHPRHEENTGKKYRWINRVEQKLAGAGWKRIAFFATLFLIFLNSCNFRGRRHVTGKFKFRNDNRKTESTSSTTSPYHEEPLL